MVLQVSAVSAFITTGDWESRLLPLLLPVLIPDTDGRSNTCLEEDTVHSLIQEPGPGGYNLTPT